MIAARLPRPRVTLVKCAMQVARGNHMTLACPPLGVAYLAATLRAQNVDVTVVDAVGEAPTRVGPVDGEPALLRYGLTDDEVIARIPAESAIIGVSAMFSEEWPIARATLRAIGRAFPHALLIAGGEHVSALPEFALAEVPELDVCVIGEGEETLGELVATTLAGGAFAELKGIVYREGNAVRRTPRRARIRSIDEIPEPAWDLLPLENYLQHRLGYGVDRGRSVPIVASRGCPYQCTFCSSPQMWTTRWSARDPSAVLDEMARAIEQYRAQNFDFYDLTAIVRRDWIVEFARRLAEKNWGITWQLPAGTRSEAIDAEVAGLLYASGCRNIAYAPESGSQSLLARVKKKADLQRMTASMRSAVAAGLKVKCNMIVGFPDERREEVDETLAFCRELARVGVHDINVTPFCPYPGSAEFEALRASGRIPAVDDAYFRMLASYSDLTRSDSFSEALSSRELALVRWSAMAQFYGLSFALHPARIASLTWNVMRGVQTTRLERAVHDLLVRNVTPVRWLRERARA